MATLPFHESILEVITNADSTDKLQALEELLLTTEIPAGHAEILEAFREKCVELDMNSDEVEDKLREEGELGEEEDTEEELL